MKILVHTFWISPYRGSEFSVVWDYITTMSQHHELVVICGTSSYTMGDFVDLDRWLETNTLKNVTFLKVKPSQRALLYNLGHKYRLSTYSFYFAYKQWEKDVYKLIESSSFISDIDLIHFAGPIGYREPGYLWKLNKPYIWGPIGGFENINWNLWMHLKGDKFRLLFRNIANSLQICTNTRVKKAITHANIVIACTMGNVNIIKKAYKKDVLYFPENGIKEINISQDKLIHNEGKLNIVWIGTMCARKMPNMLLDIALEMKCLDGVVFHMIGGGQMLPWVEKNIHKYHLDDNFRVCGQISRESLLKRIGEFDLHILTSVLEANTTVMWETMGYGIPTLTLNHCGMADVIDESCGMKIAVTDYQQIVSDFARSIDFLVLHPEYVQKMRKGVCANVVKYTWDRRMEFYENCYKKAIADFSLKQE